MSLFTKTEKPQKKSVDGIKPEARTKSNVFTRATLGISSLLLAGGLVVGCAQSENPKDVKEPQKKELKVVTPSRDNSPFAEKEIGVKAKTVADAQGTVKE